MVRFAALVHDLGKAVTPADILPSHRGHEQAGLPLIKEFCARLKVPKKYQSLALAVAEYHLHMHKMFELKAQTVLKMLEGTRSLMDDNRTLQIAQACIADARGRTSFEDDEYPQAGLFIRFQQAAKNIDAGAIASQFEDGHQIQDAVRRARLGQIKHVQSTLTQEH